MRKKILIIGPSWLGDMIMAQTMFKILKQQEDCEIDVLAPAWSLPILACMPNEVAHAIEMPVGHGKLDLRARYKLACRLRASKYQQAIVLTNSWKSALIPFWARIPQRTGWLGELRWGLLNDVRYLNQEQLPLMVQRYAALAYTKNATLPVELPIPKLEVTAEESATVCKQFGVQLGEGNIPEAFQVATRRPAQMSSGAYSQYVSRESSWQQRSSLKGEGYRPILALCPGAAFGSAKRWPESYYIELALAQYQQGWQVWLFGSQQDYPVTAEIQQGLIDLATSGENLKEKLKINTERNNGAALAAQQSDIECKNFAGKLNLPETVALLALADAVVSNDSGLMHLAASLNKPVLGIFGSTSPAFTPPLGNSAKVIYKGMACSPCMERECPLGHHKCMRDIAPSDVLQELGRVAKAHAEYVSVE